MRLFILFTFFSASSMLAQQWVASPCDSKANINGEVFTFVPNMPEFPGGIDSLKEFIKKNVIRPTSESFWEGIVYVTFVIDTSGKVRNACILKGKSPERNSAYDQAALDVINILPMWKPGTVKTGVKVNTIFNVPVSFSTKEDKKNKRKRDSPPPPPPYIPR